jgi:hypothetical protein
MEECNNSTPDSYRGDNLMMEEWKDGKMEKWKNGKMEKCYKLLTDDWQLTPYALCLTPHDGLLATSSALCLTPSAFRLTPYALLLMTAYWRLLPPHALRLTPYALRLTPHDYCLNTNTK